MIKQTITSFALITILLFACSSEKPQTDAEPPVISYAVDGLDNVISKDSVEFDGVTSSDGFGSIKINATDSMTIRLYETGDLDIENCRIFYRAKLKSENFTGTAYLEMWCSIPGLGEFFSRDLQTPITGTFDWTTEETPFVLQPGQNPDNIKLNLVVNGTGTIWIDDIKLIKGELN